MNLALDALTLSKWLMTVFMVTLLTQRLFREPYATTFGVRLVKDE
jgi:hypothetical protein